ncbi:hypothetical protein [Hymenobacter cellulosilyticus]|uniref:Outer membrane protein beta-barrel domain-containing protein n=1 Tax=Hymenobacter cellulosilyticus TaxID=2932248 RepID=A0A8T9Q6W6_9BACT|nr:hypothetical protein [Hymenobacter cellulosilyticus]UOQ71229.1 hypothetical protein MUN79_21635 [Hymenobacter cellulosilyticus]
MIRRLLFAACLTCCAVRVQAQAFEPGVLVRSNGDTLRGEIENAFWTEPPTLIRFKTTPQSPVQLFKPRQLRAVSFTGGRYFRYEVVPIDYAAETRLGQLPYGFHPDVRIDSVLADVVLEGPVLLLRVAKSGATHYLLQRPGLPILDLSERKYLQTDAVGKLLATDGNNYRGQLSIFFGDCPAAADISQKIPFTTAGLVQVVQAYNQACTTSHTATRSWTVDPRREVALTGGVLAGARYSTVKGLGRPLLPFGGIYGELLLPNRLLSFHGELSLSSHRGENTSTTYRRDLILLPNGEFDVIYSTQQSTFTYRAWLSTFRLGLRRYFHLAQQQQWFIGAGAEMRALLFSDFTTTSGPTISSDEYQDLSPLPMPNLTLGWRNGRLTTSLDAQLVPHSAWGNPRIEYRLGLAYRLSRQPDKLPTTTSTP